jgi:hypothetical protein
MTILKQLGRMVLAASLGIFCSVSALAESAEVYDGLSFTQLKAMLSRTNLMLTEQTTDKGYHYLIVAAPGMTDPFIATMRDCGNGAEGACEGFAFFGLPANGLSESGMSQFNVETPFVKAMPMKGDKPKTVIQGEYYARGGITDRYIVNSAAYFAAILQEYIGKSTPSAMNSATPLVNQALRQPMQGDRFFAALARTGNAKPIYNAALVSRSTEALVNAFGAGKR